MYPLKGKHPNRWKRVNDGVWTNNLQYVWYITKPDGSVYVPQTSENTGILEIMLNESGVHTIGSMS